MRVRPAAPSLAKASESQAAESIFFVISIYCEALLKRLGALQITQVGGSLLMTLAVGGVRPRLSNTNRTGERFSNPCRRQVSSGSSARTVPEPTAMASWVARSRWPNARARAGGRQPRCVKPRPTTRPAASTITQPTAGLGQVCPRLRAASDRAAPICSRSAPFWSVFVTAELADEGLEILGLAEIAID